MVKLKGPLHSLKASKQLGHLLIFKNYGNRNILTKYNRPGSKKPFTKSATQLEMRTRYSEAVEAWNNLSPAEKDPYNENAKSKQYSGYNLFIQEYFATYPAFGDLSYYGQRTYGIFIYGKIQTT